MTISLRTSIPEPPQAAQQMAHAPLSWLDAALALLAGGLALLLYGRAVTPGLLPGDSGEFQTLAYLLGNTHPTGYPVYLLLARVFAFLPLGNPAYRVNLFSAVMGALAVSGVFLCGRLISRYRATAVAGALAMAVSATLWSQALIAEVYTAGAAFLVFIILALLWWDVSGQTWSLYAAGLLGGLSIGVHMSVALLAPAVLLFLLLHRERGWAMWRTAVLGALSGLAVAVSLFFLLEAHNPVASYFNSVIQPSHTAWGYTADQIDGPLERLWFGWQGQQFQYLMFSDVAGVLPRQARAYGDNLGRELPGALVLFAVAGAIYLLLRRTRIAVLLLVALLTQLAFFFNYQIWDLYVFYIPSYILISLLAIAGLGGLIDLIEGALRRLGVASTMAAKGLDALLGLLVVALVVWPAVQAQREELLNGRVSSEFDEYPQYDANLELVAAATVAALPENAIVFTDWDMMWPYYYTAYLANGRGDLLFIETQPADDQAQLAASLVRLVGDNLGKRPIFFAERQPQLEALGTMSLGPRRVGPARFFSPIAIHP